MKKDLLLTSRNARTNVSIEIKRDKARLVLRASFGQGKIKVQGSFDRPVLLLEHQLRSTYFALIARQ